jgi:hypothetical protein
MDANSRPIGAAPEHTDRGPGERRHADEAPAERACAPKQVIAAPDDVDFASTVSPPEESHTMKTQTNASQARSVNRPAHIVYHDLALVSLILAALVFGNIFIVRALDVALDAWLR